MGRTIAKIVAYVLVALALVAVVGLIYKYTNGFNEDFKTFYVEYNGKQILTADNKLTLENDETYTFNVKYTFDNEKSEPKDYKVKIIPNVERDFDYTVDGEKYLYSKTGELTSAFNLEKEQAQFSITIPIKFNLQTALQSVNSGKNVSVPSDAETNNPYPYRLVVASYNGKVTYNIDLKIVDAGVKDITLNPDEIYFGGENKNETPATPTERGYNIEYLFSGDATNLSDLSLEGATQAKAGETVSYKITIGDSNYSISGMRISVMNSTEIVEITDTNGVYSFTMPQGNVYVWIYFEYTPPQDKTMYAIEYDTLGNGSVLSIDLDCPDKAAAGETVTFTVKLKDLSDVFDDYYPVEITHIVLNDMETGEEISDLGAGEGSFTFTMPETPVTIMFYLMRI